MKGQEVVQCRGSTKECEDNFWMHYEADKGGGTDSADMSENLVCKLKLRQKSDCYIHKSHIVKFTIQ